MNQCGALDTKQQPDDDDHDKDHYDDDGNGNIRTYYFSSGVRTVTNETAGTVDYKTGKKFGNEIAHAQQALTYAIGSFFR